MLTFSTEKATKPLITRRILHGDLFDILPHLDRDSIDACVTDPPYGLGFMGKEWDQLTSKQKVSAMKQQQHWHQEWAEEVWRVLKPGAYLVAFGGTRTYHRLTCALEDADFEIRDCLCWLYGTGFPKSLNVSKELDALAGAERAIVGDPVLGGGGKLWSQYRDGKEPEVRVQPLTAPTTEAAKQWEGWGTALKPAWEPIILARKPLRSTVAENVLQFGTGALNIEVCRIDAQGETWKREAGTVQPNQSIGTFQTGIRSMVQHAQGRWPANVILDEEAALQLDAQSGDTFSSGGRNANISKTSQIYGGGKGLGQDLSPEAVRGDPGYGDTGGASRFFYCAKPSREERDLGCEDLPERTGGEATDRVDGSIGVDNPRAGAGRTGGAKNFHPTVKPLALMRWLVKLITPPGGIVIDPFMGSGTTGMACVQEGMGYVVMDKEKEYVEIAQHRIDYIRKQGTENAQVCR